MYSWEKRMRHLLRIAWNCMIAWNEFLSVFEVNCFFKRVEKREFEIVFHSDLVSRLILKEEGLKTLFKKCMLSGRLNTDWYSEKRRDLLFSLRASRLRAVRKALTRSIYHWPPHCYSIYIYRVGHRRRAKDSSISTAKEYYDETP